MYKLRGPVIFANTQTWYVMSHKVLFVLILTLSIQLTYAISNIISSGSTLESTSASSSILTMQTRIESMSSESSNNNESGLQRISTTPNLATAVPLGTASNATNIDDPFENFNRNSYRMNATLDKHFIRPTTVAYITYVPSVIRTGVQNFFDNLRDFVTLGNDVLQINGIRSVKDTMRICINTTVGILGFIDVAAYAGIHEHINTFGQTMKFYGWTNSHYYMIPLIGPSTVRDALGMIPDMFFNPTWYIIPVQYVYVSVGLFVANGIDQRSKYLDFDQIINASLDPYITVRDFYLQNSGNVISESGATPVDINTLIDGDTQ